MDFDLETIREQLHMARINSSEVELLQLLKKIAFFFLNYSQDIMGYNQFFQKLILAVSLDVIFAG